MAIYIYSLITDQNSQHDFFVDTVYEFNAPRRKGVVRSWDVEDLPDSHKQQELDNTHVAHIGSETTKIVSETGQVLGEHPIQTSVQVSTLAEAIAEVERDGRRVVHVRVRQP